MKSCSVIITNYNSREAIQLCIESVRHYTNYPGLRVLVFNDLCDNDIDDTYLRQCRDKGLIELHESDKHLGHGANLNRALNEICDTQLAAVLDCDTQVKAHGWLDDLIACVNSSQVLGVADMRHELINNWGYVPGFYRMWFALLNMEAYRDGMQVDWRFSKVDKQTPPYDRMFDMLSGIPKPKTFNENLVELDPGSKLWIKIRYDNPKGYKMLFLPDKVKGKYHHYGHIAMTGLPHPDHSEQTRRNWEMRMAKIREELKRLRCQS